MTKRGRKTSKISADAFDYSGKVAKLLDCELAAEHAQATIRSSDEAFRINVLTGGRQSG
jgi:hypothetical protein